MPLHHGLRSAAGASPADPYFSSTSLLLLGNGTNGGQNNTFVDSSTNNFTITRNGNTTQGSFSPFTGAGGSGYFDGSGDYLATSATQIIPATADFTIEAWIYHQGGACIVSQGTSGNSGRLGFYVNPANTLDLQIGSTSVGSTGTITSNAWSYVAVHRTGSTVSFFINGSASGTGTLSTSVQNTSIRIGTDWDSSSAYFIGNISNLRISNNIRSISSVTSPFVSDANTSLLLNFTNASIIDSTAKNDLETVGDAQISTSVKKFGTGSMAFDGTGDYLYSVAKDGTAFGTGDFTIEFWVYGLSSAARQDWLDLYNGTVANRIQILWVSSQVAYYQNNTFVTGGGTYATSTWYHIALTRSSGSNRLFVNGTQVGSTATNTTSFSANSFYLGITNGGGTAFNGYIEDLRITKGVARYTSNFTPPSAQLPAR